MLPPPKLLPPTLNNLSARSAKLSWPTPPVEIAGVMLEMSLSDSSRAQNFVPVPQESYIATGLGANVGNLKRLDYLLKSYNLWSILLAIASTDSDLLAQPPPAKSFDPKAWP
jgi:hypothetical protein